MVHIHSTERERERDREGEREREREREREKVCMHFQTKKIGACTDIHTETHREGKRAVLFVKGYFARAVSNCVFGDQMFSFVTENAASCKF